MTRPDRGWGCAPVPLRGCYDTVYCIYYTAVNSLQKQNGNIALSRLLELKL